MARQSIAEGDRAAEAEKKARLDAATRAAVEAMVAGTDVPEEILKAGEQGDPLFRTKIGTWRESLTQSDRNPALVRRVMGDIMAGEGMGALMDAAPNITSPEDLTQLHTFGKGFEGSKGQIEEVLGSSTVRDILSTIDVRTKGVNELDLNPLSGLSNDGLEAQHDFRMLMQEWVVANPDAGFAAQQEAAQKFGKMILDRVTPGDFGEQPDYEALTEAEGFENPRRVEEAPAPAAPVRPEDQAWLDGQTPENRAAIEEMAASQGREVSDVVKDVRRIQGDDLPTAPDGTPIDPVAYRPDEPDTEGGDERPAFTPEMAEEFLSAVFEDASAGGANPAAALGQVGGLLGLIKKHEAAGNYNAVYGNSGSKRDLSSMTLDQILGQQQAARRRGVPSTAIGAYQFIYKTLRGLKDELGLKGNEPFTPELQDRMAMQLLERRGLSAYTSGRITRAQFAKRLAQEWASLPDPRTGRSFYAGDGLNASSVKTQAVYSALGFAS